MVEEIASLGLKEWRWRLGRERKEDEGLRRF